MKIFGKNIKLKKFHCRLNNLPLLESPEYINLYIQLKGCNARCEFCEWQSSANDFDFGKFNEMIDHLNEKGILVSKVSISGGEPTLDYERFKKILDIINKKLPNSFKVVNTNGLRLTKMVNDGTSKKFNSIAISRHHMSDEINDEIFKTSTPTTKFLKEISSSHNNLHLSCLFIKGYIDNTELVKEYLEYAAEVGITEVGFVNLMESNQFCKDKKVELDLTKVKGLFKTKDWEYYDGSCSCSNYLYTAKNFKVIDCYNRRPSGKASDENNNLVWDGKNLKNGFSNEIIY